MIRTPPWIKSKAIDSLFHVEQIENMGDRIRPGQGEREQSRMDDFSLAERLEKNAKNEIHTRIGPKTAAQIVKALKAHVALRSGKQGDYTVESWDEKDGLKRSFGSLNQHDAAVGAFHGAVEAFPNEHITMRSRARVLREHIPETEKAPSSRSRTGS
jgi:hypothetical protein